MGVENRESPGRNEHIGLTLGVERSPKPFSGVRFPGPVPLHVPAIFAIS